MQIDDQSPNCDAPTCRTSFNLFRRRHHCRHCGHVFCSQHSRLTIPLDQDARFHPEGIPSRACEICHRHYLRWDGARQARLDETAGRLDGGDDDGDNNKNKNDGDNGNDDDDRGGRDPKPNPPSDNRPFVPVSRGLIGGGSSEPGAGSVPKDWAWSTF
jgi:hypothetical protein